MTSLISVIMPAYNCEKFIKQAIDSILNQTYTHLELLIADDCSIDATKKIIDSYVDNRIKTFHNKSNLGYLNASNLLSTHAQGNFITFQDADDYSDITRLQKQLQFLHSNPNVDCVGTNITKIDCEGKELYKSNFALQHNEIKSAFQNYKIVMTGSALMVKKNIIEKLGLYNNYFDRVGAEDIYWFSKIIKSFSVANLPEPLYYYRTNPNSVSLTHKNQKAFVGHELIVLMYNRVLNGKVDYIETNQFEKVDGYVSFLGMIKSESGNKLRLFSNMLEISIKHPSVALQFMKPFLSKLLKS